MTTIAPTNAEKMRGLPWSIATDATSAIYAHLTVFGSVFVLFLDELNLNKSQIGFLLSLITFFGLIALFVAPPIARFGYKRTFMIFWGLRKAATGLLLFVPWISIRFGPQLTLFYVAGVIIFFALARAVAITAYYPWVQEFVPNTVRGKYSAVDNIFAALVGLLAVSGAGYVIEHSSGLNGYMLLFGIGIVFGSISVWTASYIPGGAPVETGAAKISLRDYLVPLRDPDFLRYILGAGAITLAIVPLASFLPLFMQEQVGLSSGNTVLLQTGAMLGGLVSTFFWGWAADRYGSKPALLSGIILLFFLPLLWLLMPRHSPASLTIALAIAFGQGVATMGWAIGAGRLLFVSIVPPAQKIIYMAIYYAALDVVNGLSKILGGQIVEWSANIKGQVLALTLDPYTPLFIIGLTCPIIGFLLLNKVRADTDLPLGQFAGMFLHRNTFSAMYSLIRYQFAKEEKGTVSIVEHLGQAKSALTVDELLALLKDPRFNIRFEAIISIARTRPDPRLTQALIDVISGTELSLTVIATWALGRMGDPAAIAPLRTNLDSPYRSIRAHSARALGTLGAVEVSPILLERLRQETDKGLQMAYASALGKLGAQEAAGELLKVLRKTCNQGARMELALSIARLVGSEKSFIRLYRRLQTDAPLAAADAISALQDKLKDKVSRNQGPCQHLHIQSLVRDSAAAMAEDNFSQGVNLLQQLIQTLPPEMLTTTGQQVLKECAVCLNGYQTGRIEYLILTLHILKNAKYSSTSFIQKK